MTDEAKTAEDTAREARITAVTIAMLEAIPEGMPLNDVIGCTAFVVIGVCDRIGITVEAFLATTQALRLINGPMHYPPGTTGEGGEA